MNKDEFEFVYRRKNPVKRFFGWLRSIICSIFCAILSVTVLPVAKFCGWIRRKWRYMPPLDWPLIFLLTLAAVAVVGMIIMMCALVGQFFVKPKAEPAKTTVIESAIYPYTVYLYRDNGTDWCTVHAKSVDTCNGVTYIKYDDVNYGKDSEIRTRNTVVVVKKK